MKDMVCMVRRDGTRVVYLLDKDRLPQDPVAELIRIDSKEDFVRGFFLDEIADKKAIDMINGVWQAYNRSLHGIWESPHFEEIYSAARSSAPFFFYGESWIFARYIHDTPDVIDMIDIEEL